jgi:hypothetical protein
MDKSLKVGDTIIFGEVIFIHYESCFVLFKNKAGNYYSKTFKEIERFFN